MIELKKGYGIHKKPVYIDVIDDMPIAKISLGKRKVTTISLSDIDILKKYSFYVHQRNDGSHVARSSQTGAYLHRLLLKPSEGQEIDHINHHPLNNCRGNLRVCTARQNALARESKSTTGFYGVELGRDWYSVYDPDSDKKKSFGCPYDAAEYRDECYQDYYFHRESPDEEWHPYCFIEWNFPFHDPEIDEYESWIDCQIKSAIDSGKQIMATNNWRI